MEHPFIHNLEGKSLEELQTAISDLSRKLNFAHRTTNGPLVHQLNMALDSYNAAYNKKMNELISKQKIDFNIKVDKKA